MEVNCMDTLMIIDQILDENYPERYENANRMVGTFGWFKNEIAEQAIKEYTLKRVLPKEAAEAHINGFIHIHDLGTGFYTKYCCGYSLMKLLLKGFGGVFGLVESKPPKHFSSALGQILNWLGVLQQEQSGAVAVNSFDTLLAPFVYYDKLSYKEVKQAIQEFIFNLNITIRWGHETLFSNISFDIVPPEDLSSMPVIIGGQPMDRTYEEFQEQMDMINKAFLEVMYEGDGKGTVFTFPIPTYFITKNFPWDSEIGELLCKVTAKWGVPYFQNCIGSGLKPSDVRAMCCRLQLDLRELRRNVTGGLYGSSDQTGSIGVVTINLAKLGYLAKNEDEFFELLDRYLVLAKDILELKRQMVVKYTELGMTPYTRIYLDTYDTLFNTIGVIGGHECCLNLLGIGIQALPARDFMVKVLEYIRNRIREFQEETGHLYNLEATPAEGCSYRLARIDKKLHKDIITSGSDEAPYYTNSTQLPVDWTDHLWWAIEHQEPLQTKYTGGTVFHIYINELYDPKVVSVLIDDICRKSKLPYISLTPTYSKCPEHGYIPGEHWVCPECGKQCLVFSRVCGYYRPVQQWNPGKKEEFKRRKYFVLS